MARAKPLSGFGRIPDAEDRSLVELSGLYDDEVSVPFSARAEPSNVNVVEANIYEMAFVQQGVAVERRDRPVRSLGRCKELIQVRAFLPASAIGCSEAASTPTCSDFRRWSMRSCARRSISVSSISRRLIGSLIGFASSHALSARRSLL